MEIHVRVGADKNGIVNGIDIYAVNTGAYGEHGPTTVGLSGHKSIPSLWKGEGIPDSSAMSCIQTMSTQVRTRGYGATQGLFCCGVCGE